MAMNADGANIWRATTGSNKGRSVAIVLDGYAKSWPTVNDEIPNGMPLDIIEKGKRSFEERLKKIDWKTHCNNLPFNDSALSLYEWAPIAEELKTLDKKIVLNSMILKWDNIQKEFIKLIKF